MKLLFVISTLRCGGAPKVLTILANGLSGLGHTVSILTFEDKETRPFFPVDSSIKLEQIGFTGSGGWVGVRLYRTFHRIHCIRKIVRHVNPDAVISFLTETNVLVALSLFGLGIPSALAERNDPARYPASRLWKFLRVIIYPLGSRIVVQAESFKNSWWRPFTKVAVIGNPLPLPRGLVMKSGNHEKNIVCVARLDPQKGIDVLLRAFVGVRRRHPDWTLHLAGEGVSMMELKNQAGQLKIESSVIFHGTVPDVGPLLAKADIFVLPSRFEGFPNSLAEAMVAGLPVISTENPGSKALIESDVNGILVPVENDHALSEAMLRLIENPDQRRQFGLAAAKSINRFSDTVIVKEWEDLLRTVS